LAQSLQKPAEGSSGIYDLSRVGDLVGGIFDGFMKSMGSLPGEGEGASLLEGGKTRHEPETA
jgi:hypothetical protein